MKKTKSRLNGWASDEQVDNSASLAAPSTGGGDAVVLDDGGP